jgi:hypothetical protein
VAVLNPRAALRLSVGNARERDHRVKRQVKSGQRRFEKMVELLFGAKCFQRRLVAHLDEVPECEIGEGVGIDFSLLEIFREGALRLDDRALAQS